jgi:hypothetical protein
MQADPQLLPRRTLNPTLIVVAVVVAVALTAALSFVLPDGVDWQLTYRPAALAVLRGISPYDPSVSPEAPFAAAPWVVLPLIPLALLPIKVGRAIIFIAAFAAVIYVARKMRGSLLTSTLLLLSPPVLHMILNANVDWIPLLGFVLPPQIGLFFISTKPQVGYIVGVFWLFEAWRSGGWREVLRVFGPFTIVVALSFLLFGFWPMRGGELAGEISFNASLWPLTIPVGLGLLVASIRKRDMRYAMGASPCLSPYVIFHSWSGAVMALVSSKWEFVAVFIGLWVLILIRAGVFSIP